MIVGFMGGIPFYASRHAVHTFDNFEREGSARYAKHDIIGKKPVLEYIGPDLDGISFEINLQAELGVDPETALDKLRKLRDNGKAFSIVVGGRRKGKYFWVIESLSEKTTYWSRTGQMLSAHVSVKLKEYFGRAV